MSVHQDVILGGLPLMLDGADVPSADGYTLSVKGDDATLGQIESVTTTLFSMLSAGSIVTRDRAENRQPAFVVEVTAPLNDGLALARGEAALRAVCCRPVELVWRPPQEGAPVAVFDVVDSTFDLIYDDLDESNVLRAYQITMNALPYARSAEVSVFPAVEPGDDTLTSFNNADSTTGWSSSDTMTDVGSALRFTNALSAFTIDATLSFAAATLSEAYVIVEYRTSLSIVDPAAPSISLSTTPGGGKQDRVFQQAVDTEWRRAWFRVALPTTVTSLTFIVDLARAGTGDWLEIRDVLVTDAPPALGTRRQIVHAMTVGGSETTQGSINVDHATDPLGDVLIYTRPDDDTPYAPSLSPWVTTGTAYRAVDATAVSGYAWDVVTAGGLISFNIPAAAIPPGDYHVVARVKRTDSDDPIPLRVETSSRAHHTPSSIVLGFDSAYSAPSAVEDKWVIRALGTVTLPYARVGTNGDILLYVMRTVIAEANGSILLDDVWLCKTDGSLTIIEGVQHPHIQVVAPSLAEPTGTVWSMAAADMVEAYVCSAQCQSRQHHDLAPGDNLVFIVTTGVEDADVSATAFKRWSHFPSS